MKQPILASNIKQKKKKKKKKKKRKMRCDDNKIGKKIE